MNLGQNWLVFTTVLYFSGLYFSYNTINSIFSFLQILPNDFGSFLKGKKHSHLRLCGSSNSITTCKLYFEDNQQQTQTIVKIGRSWTTFMLKNNIYPNDILEFKCDSIMATNIVIVIKYDESSRHLF